ncbi:MAG: SRPBCC domain-containing protein [Thaumarchaeota archaeon]|nr:SRPBCC domain-containing protein [Nitrososphaerota archaeon]
MTLSKGLVAKTSVTINTPVARVWNALVNPEAIRQYMFGTKVVPEWKNGSPITWKGVWEGKEYEDHGVILDLEPENLIQYSHFSPLAGLPDISENYHTVTIQLSEKGDQTLLSLSQDNNPTDQAREHSEKNWRMMLDSLKKLVEGTNH